MSTAGPRTGGQIAMMIIAAAILALSALLCAGATIASLDFAHDVTCEATAPVEYRHQILIVGLVAYAICAIPALVLTCIGRTPGLVVAIILACLALGPPALSFVFALFSSALC